MPRRNGRFQQALVVWFEINRTRFAVPARLKMMNGGCVVITLRGQPACLSITACTHNLSAWVSWHGQNWDALLDLDVQAVKTTNGFRCTLCDSTPVQIWPDPEALWADHLFEEFLRWVNQRYAKAESIELFGNEDSISVACLHFKGQPSKEDEQPLSTVLLDHSPLESTLPH